MTPGVKLQRGFIIIFACVILSPSSGLMRLGDIRNVHDLCRANRHLYEMSENSSFELHLRSDAKSSGRDKMALKKLKTKCTLTLKVCSYCHVELVIKNMNIPSCSGNCSCNYFEITEPLSSYRSAKFCGDKESKITYFESKTKIIDINFVQSVHERFYVSLSFSVKRNVYFYTEHISPVPNYIETPYFPDNYPSDYEAEYVFKVLSPFGYVELLFIDFQLSEGSYIEVSEHNGTRVEVFNGAVFRPPVIVSHNVLRVRFIANDQPVSTGFRAMYRYGLDIGDYPLVKLHTDCGGNKEGYGGAIELSIPLSSEELFDCIWLISPPLFVHQHSYLAASVSKFRNIGSGSSLEFRKGLTSKSELVQFKQCHHPENCSFELGNVEVIAQATNGFYIRFRGYLKRDSHLYITYYKFKEENCSKNDFVCQNGTRCVNIALVCDGYSHCLDGSDETSCQEITRTETGQREAGRRPLVKNYIFIGDDDTFLVLTSLGSFGTLLFFLIVVIVVYNNHKDDRLSRPQNQRRRNAVVFTDSPLESVESTTPASPLSDEPPSYEEVSAYNERYPPLFYTRLNRETVETCLDETFFQQTCLNCHESFPMISFTLHRNAISASKTLSFSINCRNSFGESKGFCDNFISSRLIKSLSLDYGMEKRIQRRCSCKLPELFQSVYCPDCANNIFRSFSYGFNIHSPAAKGLYCQYHLINMESSNYIHRSCCTFPGCSAETLSFPGNIFWPHQTRTKSYSF